MNTGITIPSDEALVSDEESVKDKNDDTVVQVKPLSKPKNQKGDKMSNDAHKRKEIDEQRKENNTSKIVANEEDLVLDDEHGDECKETTGNQIETNIVRGKPKHNRTKTKGNKRKQSKDIQDKMRKSRGKNQKKQKSILHKVETWKIHIFQYDILLLTIHLLLPSITNRYQLIIVIMDCWI